MPETTDETPESENRAKILENKRRVFRMRKPFENGNDFCLRPVLKRGWPARGRPRETSD